MVYKAKAEMQRATAYRGIKNYWNVPVVFKKIAMIRRYYT